MQVEVERDDLSAAVASMFGSQLLHNSLTCLQVEVEADDLSDLAGRLQQMCVRLDLVKLFCPGE